MLFGIDEVGRGCWAGPMVVAAVALGASIDGLDDSKKLTGKKRAKLASSIIQDYNIVIIKSVSAREIDQMGLTEAMGLACLRLFSEISKHSYDRIIIDGNVNFLEGKKGTEALIGADGSIQECMAASIVAKEFRDERMRKLAIKYPGYGFESHVGYGTKQHILALAEYGPTPQHRMSYKPLHKYVDTTRSQS